MVSRKDPVLDDIKQVTLKNDIASCVKSYFEKDVLPDMNPYPKNDVLQRMMNVIVQDTLIAQRQKEEFQRIYDSDNYAFFSL